MKGETVRRQTKGSYPLRGWCLQLEITGRCQLACDHCYADSGPKGAHGTVTSTEWRDLITNAVALGVSEVQFIGGEPTLHPDFGELLCHAISAGLEVEVFSNLTHLRSQWWEMFDSPRVSLATSYYSDQAAQHDRITGRRGSHARTQGNIAEAVRRGIPIRAGIVDMFDGQRIWQARVALEALGVSRIGVDRVRGIGRGACEQPDAAQLCGGCGRGMAAISAVGDVWPCVLSRWMRAGNIKERPLAEILTGRVWERLVASVPTPRADPQCGPDKDDCRPKKDGGDCHPAEKPACNPRYCGPELGPKDDPKKR